MENITCSFCNKTITSKSDLLLGTHYVSNVTPYHVACFDDAKKKLSFFSKPVMKVPPSKFNFFIGTNVFNIVMGLLILLFADKLAIICPFSVVIVSGLFILLIGLMFTTSILKYKN